MTTDHKSLINITMRNIAKYLFVAVMALFAFAACEKPKENELLNPKGKPVHFTFSARATSDTEAELKVTSDVAVPADVTIAIGLDDANTMSEAGMTYPTQLVIPKGETEVTGELSVDKEKLVPGTTTTAVFKASAAGVVFGSAEAITIKTEPKEEPKPIDAGETDIKIDGDFSDWADVKTLIVSDDDISSRLLSGFDARPQFSDQIEGTRAAKQFPLRRRKSMRKSAPTIRLRLRLPRVFSH